MKLNHSHSGIAQVVPREEREKPRGAYALRSPAARGAFTLVEMLVVIAVIGVLIALLLPAIQAARESSRRTACKSNLRQIAQALHMHHDSQGSFPAGWTTNDPNDPEGEPGWGWAVRILPYIEASHISDQLDLKEPITDPAFAASLRTYLFQLGCPSDGGSTQFMLTDVSDAPLFEVGRSNYVGVFGTEEIEDDPANGDGSFFQNSRLSLHHYGAPTMTFLVGERSTRTGLSTWIGVVPGAAEAMARIVGAADHPPNHTHAHLDDFSSDHPQGAHFAFADTAVRMIASDIDADVYKALATRDARDEVPGTLFKD